MKKLAFLFLALVLVTGASGTTIENEDVVIDLEDSSVSIEMHIGDLTSSQFTYVTNYPVENLETRMDGRPVNCSVEELQIGSEIKCRVNRTTDFNVSMDFETSGLVNNVQNVRVFRYSQSIYRPTDNYSLMVILPRGSATVSTNSSQPAISPAGETGSNGRRIFVRWVLDPNLGESLNFHVYYEDVSEGPDYGTIIAVLFAGAVILLSLYVLHQIVSQESLESLYSELSSDQVHVLEILAENDGEMLQKDVVDQSDYSKAKISGIVSELVDREIISKKKEGRSNKLAISRKYRF